MCGSRVLDLAALQRGTTYQDGFDQHTVHFIVSPTSGDDLRLPPAHTCFNNQLLPAYSSREVAEQKIRYAISEAQGFATTHTHRIYIYRHRHKMIGVKRAGGFSQ